MQQAVLAFNRSLLHKCYEKKIKNARMVDSL